MVSRESTARRYFSRERSDILSTSWAKEVNFETAKAGSCPTNSEPHAFLVDLNYELVFLCSQVVFKTEITKNGYTRSSNNHFRVQRKSSTRTPPGRPLIGRTTVVPGSGSKQSGCTRCAELMFRSTRYWLPLYPELVRSVQATRRRAHTPTRARVHTRISE